MVRLQVLSFEIGEKMRVGERERPSVKWVFVNLVLLYQYMDGTLTKLNYL